MIAVHSWLYENSVCLSEAVFFAVQEVESVGRVAFIHDLSFNGTFLNGTKIGTPVCCFVSNYDLI